MKKIIGATIAVVCPWCHNGDRSKLDFSIIDDDFGQYVEPRMIKFCPFCGRELK